MRGPRVTICVPTIGRVHYLQDTLRSVSRQTFPDIEILVLDNASPTVASDALSTWTAADNRIRVLRVDSQVGMFENFNRGIHAASGEYLAFCHDDDELDPEYVSTCVDFMRRHPTVSFCGSNYSVMDSAGRVVERRYGFRRNRVWKGQNYILRVVAAGRNLVTMQSVFYRRSALPAEGIDTRLSPHFGDLVFLMRMAESGDVGAIARDLVRVRRHAGQTSGGIPMSVQIPLRTRTIAAYCSEFRQRHPGASALAAVMHRANRLAHRAWIGWSWLRAEDEAEALSCATEFGRHFPDRVVCFALKRLSNSGLRQRGRGVLFRAARGLLAARASVS